MFEQRFNDLAKISGKLKDIKPLHQQQREFEERLRSELTYDQFQIILNWEEVMNYLHAIQKEWLYLKGIQDGMKIFKELHSFMSD